MMARAPITQRDCLIGLDGLSLASTITFQVSILTAIVRKSLGVRTCVPYLTASSSRSLGAWWGAHQPASILSAIGSVAERRDKTLVAFSYNQ